MSLATKEKKCFTYANKHTFNQEKIANWLPQTLVQKLKGAKIFFMQKKVCKRKSLQCKGMSPKNGDHNYS